MATNQTFNDHHEILILRVKLKCKLYLEETDLLLNWEKALRIVCATKFTGSVYYLHYRLQNQKPIGRNRLCFYIKSFASNQIRPDLYAEVSG